jgi:hypothetical protein
MLLEACSSTVPALRPLSATLAAPVSKGDRATVRLASPTGRRVDVLAIRVGGVALQMSPARPSVVGKATTAVQLTAPTTCPMQWQVAGFPSALTIDLTREPVGGGPPSPTAESSTARLPLGLALTSWLAATSCGAAA